jgi:UrcA family protein
MTIRRFTSLSAAAALLVACAVVAPAARAAEMDTQSLRIELHGAKLNTPEGRAALRARAVVAAKQVCGSADTNDLAAMADMQACRKAAIFQAMSQVDIAIAAAQPHPASSVMVSSNTH